MPEKETAELWMTHLRMIQEVVSRQATSAAWMKRLCLVVVAGVVAFAGRGGNTSTLVMAMGLVVVFAFLDASYHRQERWFRNLYERVRERGPTVVTDFSLTPDSTIRENHSLHKSLSSWSIWILYASLLLFLILFWVVS